jgi:sugar-specific transcriptional regulator TrmB
MTDDSEFITRFMRLGLSEKEAQLYLHLRRYGPESLSVLATLENHEEDIYRTLNSLIDKGLVTSSFDSQMFYAAVDLDVALNAMVTKHEMELREKERRKQELQELSKQQQFRPSDEVITFKIIKNIKEFVALTTSLVALCKEGFLFVMPEPALLIVSLFGINDAGKKVVEHGRTVRGIIDISYSAIELAQELIDTGEDIRYLDDYKGIYFAVFDRKTSISAINVDIKSVSLDETISALVTDDPKYAEYLTSTFEFLWEQAIPAEQRIEELLKGGPPNV